MGLKRLIPRATLRPRLPGLRYQQGRGRPRKPHHFSMAPQTASTLWATGKHMCFHAMHFFCCDLKILCVRKNSTERTNGGIFVIFLSSTAFSILKVVFLMHFLIPFRCICFMTLSLLREDWSLSPSLCFHCHLHSCIYIWLSLVTRVILYKVTTNSNLVNTELLLPGV